MIGLEDEYFVDPDGHRAGVVSVPAADVEHSGERLLSEGMVLGGPGMTDPSRRASGRLRRVNGVTVPGWTEIRAEDVRVWRSGGG